MCVLPEKGSFSLFLEVDSALGSVAIAYALANVLQPPLRIGLSGELGAGKTAFVRAFLNALSPGLRVQSPTYVLEQVYDVPLGERMVSVAHWDLYRLTSDTVPDDLTDAERFAGIVFIEWPERASGLETLLDLGIFLSYPTEVGGGGRRASQDSRRQDAADRSFGCSAKSVSERSPDSGESSTLKEDRHVTVAETECTESDGAASNEMRRYEFRSGDIELLHKLKNRLLDAGARERQPITK